MADQKGEIEQETQHEKKQAATREAEHDADETSEADIEQETQHEKKAAARDPSAKDRN